MTKILRKKNQEKTQQKEKAKKDKKIHRKKLLKTIFTQPIRRRKILLDERKNKYNDKNIEKNVMKKRNRNVKASAAAPDTSQLPLIYINT